jgi:hypothetical protein
MELTPFWVLSLQLAEAVVVVGTTFQAVGAAVAVEVAGSHLRAWGVQEHRVKVLLAELRQVTSAVVVAVLVLLALRV